MAAWVQLTALDLRQVFDAAELAALSDQAPDAIDDMVEDMAAYVRECVAQNRANRLPADPLAIPRSLRAAALDVLTVRVLKRFTLTVTDARQQLAAAGEEALRRVADGKLLVLSEDGSLPTAPADVPVIVAAPTAYGNAGQGFYPVP